QGRVIGVITDRDARFACTFSGPGLLSVRDIMTEEPYFVRLHTTLEDVLFEMESKRHSCAIVLDAKGNTVGIFTEIDAMRVLRDVLTDYIEIPDPTIEVVA